MSGGVGIRILIISTHTEDNRPGHDQKGLPAVRDAWAKGNEIAKRHTAAARQAVPSAPTLAAADLDSTALLILLSRNLSLLQCS